MTASVQQAISNVNLAARVGKIIREMKNDYGWTGPEFTALAKAQTELGAEQWTFDATTNTLVIASRTARSKRYRVTETNCCDARTGEPCRQSGQVHWHAAALEVLRRAHEPERVIRPQTDAEYAATVAACDELF